MSKQRNQNRQKNGSTSSRAKKKGALKGALGGALAGALSAAALGKNPLAGAAIGAAAGALTGFLIGKRKDRIFKSRDQAVAELGYDPSQGYVIEVQEVAFDPPNLLPGETSQLHIRYVVIGPDPKEKIVIQAYTGLKYDDNYIFARGPKNVPIPRGGGIVETTMQITLPEDAPAGSYVVEAQFEERQGRFEQAKTGPLYVTEPESSEEESAAS